MIEYKNRLGGKKIILVSPDGSITIVENGNQTELTVNKEKIFTLEVSSSPEIDNDKYNNFGLLTDDVTVIYPPQDPGVVKIFYGQFQADVNGQYSVDFGDVVMTGDTEINPYSTYLFEIIGDHGTLKEIKYNGFFGKTINGFSGDHVVVSINGTNTNIDVDSDGWFFKEVQPTTTSIKFNTTDKTNFEKIYLSGVKGNINTAINMFNGCSSLTYIDVSNFNTAAVTDMSYMFYNCNKLTSIDVSNFSTAAVTNMQAMFYDCKLIVNLNIDNFILTVNVNVTSIFTNNISLLTIYLRNSDTTTYDIINAAKPAGATIVTA